MYKFIRDTYLNNRGSVPRVLDILCDHCENHVVFYQKDGPGMLKRMYIDRFIDLQPSGKSLTCPTCKSELGIEMIYKKENRPAYRLFVGAVRKKIIAANNLPEKF